MDLNTEFFHKNGLRLTEQRKSILIVLTDHPQSITEICHRLKYKKSQIDQVTVYRTLSCLVKLGIVGKTKFKDNNAKYELLDQKHHHHHLVCEKCGLVQDIPINDDFLMSYISKTTDFKITSHSLEFFGKCQKCQK